MKNFARRSASSASFGRSSTGSLSPPLWARTRRPPRTPLPDALRPANLLGVSKRVRRGLLTVARHFNDHQEGRGEREERRRKKLKPVARGKLPSSLFPLPFIQALPRCES